MKSILLVLLCINFSFAQTLSSSLDKKNVELGEPVVFTIRINNLDAKPVLSSAKNELLSFHFEEIKDEIQQDENHYTRIIEFSIFDEGTFTIPALEFKIGDSVHTTIPYEIEVVNSNIDDEINDILPNKEIELEWSDYWVLYKWYVLGVLLLIVISFLVIFFTKYSRKKTIEHGKITNHIRKDLEQLKQKQYIEKGEFRTFYIELIDICRAFLMARYGIPANVLLTDDLIDYINQNQSISIENKKMIKDILLRGDLVKFAKTIPHQDLMKDDLMRVEAWIKSIS